MDLTGILSFNMTFDVTGVPKLIIEDDSDYTGNGITPADVSVYIRITNPDGYTVGDLPTGTPSIVGQSATYEQNLRKDYRNRTQLGMYVVRAVAVHGGDETVLQRVYQFLYERKEHVITKDFDVFTPSLIVSDDTNYDYGGYTETVVRAWSVDVPATTNTLTGTSQTIDVADTGVYYDTQYDVSLTTDITLDDVTYTWAKIVDRISSNVVMGAQRPLTCSQLEDQLTIYRTELVSHFGVNNVTFQRLRQEYEYLAALMFHIQQRALAADYDGLEPYMADWTNVSRYYNPDNYTYLDLPLLPYSWDCNLGGASDWNSIQGKPTTFTPSAHRHPTLRVDLPALTQTHQVTHNWGHCPGVQVFEDDSVSLKKIVCEIAHDSVNAFTITLTQPSPNPLVIFVINDENI